MKLCCSDNHYTMAPQRVATSGITSENKWKPSKKSNFNLNMVPKHNLVLECFYSAKPNLVLECFYSAFHVVYSCSMFLQYRLFITWCPLWCQPPYKFFYPLIRSPSPLIWNMFFPTSQLFLEHRSLFLDLLISFIKPFKTLDFSKHVSHVTTL